MFEIGVFTFILFAVGYWATLFIMGRREDVLHGQFVEAEPELVAAMAGVPASFPQPILPARKRAAFVSSAARPPVVEPVAVVLPALEQPSPAPEPASTPAAPSPEAEAWESLFASIKLELKNAAQI
jgi:hypothetical protein